MPKRFSIMESEHRKYLLGMKSFAQRSSDDLGLGLRPSVTIGSGAWLWLKECTILFRYLPPLYLAGTVPRRSVV